MADPEFDTDKPTTGAASATTFKREEPNKLERILDALREQAREIQEIKKMLR